MRGRVLDVAAGSVLVGGVAVAVLGRDAESARRAWPVLVFLAAVVPLAELTARAGTFDVVASWLARRSGGRVRVLFGLCVVFATVTTVVLNLDATAVLLTPVLLATALRAGLPGEPAALLGVWLANTASLLLPGSNLTNLLAADRIGLSPLGFAGRMALPELAAVTVTAGCLWVLSWRSVPTRRFVPPPPYRPADRVLARTAAVACLGMVTLVLAGVPIEVAAVAAAVVLAAVYARRDRAALRPGLVPYRLLAVVAGLVLLAPLADRAALDHLIGGGPWRTAATGAVLSNLVNNLPAYVAGEGALPPGDRDQLLALLLGTNIGPLVTPWASVATVLWAGRCRAAGVRIRWGRFAVTGAITATLSLAAALTALHYT